MSTLLEELNKNKVIEDAVQPNKMSKFAYTEKAYEDNDAAGVDSFNFEAEQNIPSDKISVLQTNETVILKGFKAQASVVPRALFDHFFGRASYNLNKVHDVVKGVLDAFVKFIGKANGIATLDENGRIPYSQLPESVMEFKGTVISLVNDLAVNNWTAISDMKFRTYPRDSVTYGNGKFVAVGYSGKGAYSLNLIA